MKVRILLVIALIAVAVFVAERNLRLGRDLIFRSDDVVEFTLPNGKVPRTNRWYRRADLLEEGQEFYLPSSSDGLCLGVMNPKLDGVAMLHEDMGPRRQLYVLRVDTTQDKAIVTPVGQEASPARDGQYDEYWVTGHTKRALALDELHREEDSPLEVHEVSR